MLRCKIFAAFSLRQISIAVNMNRTNIVAKQVAELAGRQTASVFFGLKAQAVGSTSATTCAFSDVHELCVRCVYPNVTGVAEITQVANSRGDKYRVVNGTALYADINNLAVGTYVVTVSGIYGSVPFESKVVIVVGSNEQHADVTGLSSFNAEVPEVMYIETPATPTKQE